jgi:hypothetical protein
MTFLELLAAAEKGAASVYHAVLATGAEINTWESNPLVTPLVGAGVAAANEMLTRAGVSTETAGVIESDVTTALKTIAAADPTVPSVGGLVTTLGAMVTDFVPAAAPIVAVSEGVVKDVEAAAATPA